MIMMILQCHTPLIYHQLPAEQAAPANGHDQAVDEQVLSQGCQPPPSSHFSQSQEIDDGTKTEETKHTFKIEEFSDMKEIMEDLRKSIRESVRDAFKPP